jgi:hypothetical protein
VDSHIITGDRGIFISDDGDRRAETLLNITHKKRRVRLNPEDMNDSLAAWVPVRDFDGELCEEDWAAMDAISGSSADDDLARGKRKSYVSSVSLSCAVQFR